jgi:MFS family permease
MLLALGPMAVSLALIGFVHSFIGIAVALFAFFFAYYIYEPPYRGLYPDLLPDTYFGRAQGVQHLFRGAALGGALVGGGFLFSVWSPFPFVLAAGITLLACGAVVVLVREPPAGPPQYERLRTFLAQPLRVVSREKNVRRFLIANTAWEATFAGMRTFVVLYIIKGLGEPLYVSSTVLAVVAVGYMFAAALATRFGDHWGLGNVIVGASVVYGLGLLGAGLATSWHWWFYGFIFPVALAGGTVMTLAWGLLFKVSPSTDRGTVTGLATTTKGIGLIVGPLAAGAAIDISSPYLSATSGYGALWPVMAVPVLAAIPFVVKLAEVEAGIRGKATRPAR